MNTNNREKIIQNCSSKVLILLVPILIVFSASSASSAFALLTDNATSWSNFGSPGYVQEYTQGGVTTTDEETSSDSTNGGAAVSPCTLDLASEGNPGGEATEHYGYYDGGTAYDPDDPTSYQDDYIFFRMRIVCDPRKNTATSGGFVNNHYNVLIDVDGDGYKEYWVDLDGTTDANNADELNILYEDLNRQDFADIATAEVNQFTANWSDSNATSHTRAYIAPTPAMSTEWYIEIQVPLTAFTDTSGNQVVFPNTPIAFAFSTSASNTNPLQKDWSRELDPDGGAFSLTDPIVFGDTVVPNGEGLLHFTDAGLENELEFFNVGDNLYIYLADPGLNTSSSTADTTTVVITDQTTGDSETITLTETGVNTGIFTNTGAGNQVTTSTTVGAADDGDLETGPGNVIQVTYTDADDGDNDPDNNTKNDTMIAVGVGSCFLQFTRSAGLDVSTYDVGDNIYITLADSSLDTNPAVAETLVATANTITSAISGDSETNVAALVLTETGVNTGIFRNTTAMTMSLWGGGAPTTNNGDLESLDADTLTVTYIDPVTPADTCVDTAGVQDSSGNAGRVQFTNSTGTQNLDVYVAGNQTQTSDLVYVTVMDANANTLPLVAETLSVTIDVLDGTMTVVDTFVMTVTETGPDTGQFRNLTGLILEYDLSPETAAILESGDGYTLRATYTDANDGDAVAANDNKTDTATAVASQVLIDNVVYDPCTSGVKTEMESVTLYNPTDVDQDISGWRLSDGDAGGFVYDIPATVGGGPVVLAMGKTAVIRFIDGPASDAVVNGIYLLHAGAALDGTLDNNEDQISLYSSSTESAANLIDFVSWDNDGTHAADWSSDDTNGVVAKKWDDEDYTNAAAAPATCYALQRSTVGFDGNQGGDFGVVDLAALAIELQSFAATPYQDWVLLEWQTAAEMDNLGFNIYRSESATGNYVQINANLIYGLLNSPTGGKYFFIDQNVEDGKTYYYLLEDVETSGVSEFHGPALATVSGALPLFGDSGFDPFDYINGDFSGVGDSGAVDSDGSDPPSDPPAAVIVEEIKDGATLTGLIIEFQPKAPQLTPVNRNGNDYWQVDVASYPGSGSSCDPKLPARNFLFAVPEQELSFQVLTTETVNIPLPVGEPVNPVADVQAVLDLEGNPMGLEEVFCINNTLYQSGDTVPSSMTEWFGGSFIASQHYARIGIHPVTWQIDSNRLTYATRIVVQIDFGKPIVQDNPDIDLPENQQKQFEIAALANALKIRIEDAGLYKISYADLADAGFPVNLNPQNFQIYYQGREQAIWVSGQEDGSFDPVDFITFYGKENLIVQSERKNTYWLLSGAEAGIRMEQSDVTPLGNEDIESFFWQEIKVSENHIYYPSAPEGEDHWFWAYGIPNSPFFALPPFTFWADQIAFASGESGLMEVRLLAVTPNPDHHVKIWLNGNLVDEVILNGDESFKATLSFPLGFLLAGENEITLEHDDPLYANDFRLQIPKLFEASSDHLAFSTSLFGDHTVTGFDSNALMFFDVTDSENPEILTGFDILVDGPGFLVNFRSPDHPLESKVIGTTQANLSTAFELLTNEPSSLHDVRNRGDYLILSPEDFYVEAEQYAFYRGQTGYHVKLINVQEIYDEFGFGNLSAQAIQDFLRYAKSNWQIPPEYVLLIGDGTYDYKNYLGDIVHNQNYIPVPLVTTNYHETGSDSFYAQMDDGDLYPDIAVGRLPVHSFEELARILARIVVYESTPFSGTWDRSIALVEDDVDSPTNDKYFRQYAQEIASQLPADYHPIRISEDGLGGIPQTQQAILDVLNGDSFIVNWLGHGWIQTWGSEYYFQNSDIANLVNETQMPIVIASNCLNAQFYNPGEYLISISEQMLTAENGGAIAFWSTSALSTPQAQGEQNKAFFNALLGTQDSGVSMNLALSTGSPKTLGQTIVLASNALDGNLLGSDDVLRSWNLMGDPGLKIPMPPTAKNSDGDPSSGNMGSPSAVSSSESQSSGGCSASPQTFNLTLVLALLLPLVAIRMRPARRKR